MQRLTFLGTSAGLPTKNRNVTGLAVALLNPYQNQKNVDKNIDKNSSWLLVDCGEGTQHQLLRTPLSLLNLAVICITHVHGDHCYGLAGLLSSMAMSGRKKPLTIIAPQAIAKLLDTLTITTELYFTFEVHFIALESLKQADGLFTPFEFDISPNHHVRIEPIGVSHRTPSHAYKICQTIHANMLNSQKLQNMGIKPSAIWGKLQHGFDVTLDNDEILFTKDFVEQKTICTNIIVGGDNDKPEMLANFCQDIGLLVHEATYTQAIADKIKNRPNGFDPQHSSVEQVAKFAQVAKIPNLILTHISARFQTFDKPNESLPNIGHLRVEAERFYQKKYRENLWIAKDFDVYEVVQNHVKKLSYHKHD